MKLLYLLNYKIYCFAKRRGDADPDVYSSVVGAIFPVMNLIVVEYALLHASIVPKSVTKYNLVYYITILGINYFLVYYNSKHKQIFAKIGQEWDGLSIDNRKINIYMICSVSIYLAYLSYLLIIRS
jgi:hypothetical protein